MAPFLFKFLATVFWGISYPEETLLENVEQLTFPTMGFQEAGEAYFSPDGRMISFQQIPKGETGYQISIMNLDTKEVRQVSHGAEACTCSFFRPDGKKIIFAASPIKDMCRTTDITTGTVRPIRIFTKPMWMVQMQLL